jgi:hypothetical protein
VRSKARLSIRRSIYGKRRKPKGQKSQASIRRDQSRTMRDGRHRKMQRN